MESCTRQALKRPEMPTYQFRCPKCRREIELQRSIKDESKPLCCEDSCGGIEMEQLISTTSFILSGNGWARDGYSK